MSPIETLQHQSPAARSFDLALVLFILTVFAALALGASGIL